MGLGLWDSGYLGYIGAERPMPSTDGGEGARVSFWPSEKVSSRPEERRELPLEDRGKRLAAIG